MAKKTEELMREARVKMLLCHNGLPTWAFTSYHAFAREYAKLLSRIQAKWLKKGLDPRIMRTLLHELTRMELQGETH